MSRSRFRNHTATHFILSFITVVIILHMLRTGWKSKEKGPADVGPIVGGGTGRDRLVVAHFMVGRLGTHPTCLQR